MICIYINLTDSEAAPFLQTLNTQLSLNHCEVVFVQHHSMKRLHDRNSPTVSTQMGAHRLHRHKIITQSGFIKNSSLLYCLLNSLFITMLTHLCITTSISLRRFIKGKHVQVSYPVWVLLTILKATVKQSASVAW